MKVLVQWSQAQAEDWREYDSAEWAGLPSKGLPAGSEVMDETLGYVTALNCQGVSFVGYDHYVCEDLPGGACRITAWKDDLEDAALDLTAGNVPPGLDPSQYGPADLLYARVWEFEPVAKYDGRIYNTRQRQTIYAGKAIRDFYAALGPVENTTVVPWEEFVPPPAAITRHGVWMPDDLMRAHEQAQSLHPWMEWAPEPVIPQGPEHHSITYLFNAPNTLDSDCVPATDHNNKMDEAGQTSEDLSSVFTGGENKIAFAFTTVAGDPNSADWPSGAYAISFNIITAGAEITYFRTAFSAYRRVNSGCVVQDDATPGTGNFTGTGVKTDSKTFDPAAGAATDRYQIIVTGIRAASHGNQTLTLRTDASSFAQGPWSVAGALLEGSIGMTGTLVGVLTTAITMAGAAAANLAAAAVLTTQIMLGGAVAGQMAPAAALTTEIQVAGAVAGQLTPSGDLTTSQQALLEGQIAGMLQVAADLTTEIRLTGTAAGGATLSGDLEAGSGAAAEHLGLLILGKLIFITHPKR